MNPVLCVQTADQMLNGFLEAQEPYKKQICWFLSAEAVVLVKQHCFGWEVLSHCSQAVCHHKPQNGTCGSAVLSSALIHTIVVSCTAINTDQKCTKQQDLLCCGFSFLCLLWVLVLLLSLLKQANVLQSFVLGSFSLNPIFYHVITWLEHLSWGLKAPNGQITVTVGNASL